MFMVAEHVTNLNFMVERKMRIKPNKQTDRNTTRESEDKIIWGCNWKALAILFVLGCKPYRQSINSGASAGLASRLAQVMEPCSNKKRVRVNFTDWQTDTPLRKWSFFVTHKQSHWHFITIQGCFLLFLLILSTKMKNELQPTKGNFSGIFQSLKFPC